MTSDIHKAIQLKRLTWHGQYDTAVCSGNTVQTVWSRVVHIVVVKMTANLQGILAMKMCSIMRLSASALHCPLIWTPHSVIHLLLLAPLQTCHLPYMPLSLSSSCMLPWILSHRVTLKCQSSTPDVFGALSCLYTTNEGSCVFWKVVSIQLTFLPWQHASTTLLWQNSLALFVSVNPPVQLSLGKKRYALVFNTENLFTHSVVKGLAGGK